MTYGQVLENRGKVQGMQQGMRRKSLEIAKNMLSELHLDMEAMRRITGLSKEELKRISAESGSRA